MSRDRMYLEHILDCIERIEAYTHDGRDAFLASTMIQDAVIRNFEMIGEATKRLTPTGEERTTTARDGRTCERKFSYGTGGNAGSAAKAGE